MHVTNNGHNGIAPVPGHAEAQHFQRTRLHHGLLNHVATVSRGAQTHLGNHSRDQSKHNILFCLHYSTLG